MSSIRKIMAAEQRAYDAYTHAAAELIAYTADEQNVTEDRAAHLRRRAAAYRVQWDAAVRRAEQACIARGRVDA